MLERRQISFLGLVCFPPTVWGHRSAAPFCLVPVQDIGDGQGQSQEPVVHREGRHFCRITSRCSWGRRAWGAARVGAAPDARLVAPP